MANKITELKARRADIGSDGYLNKQIDSLKNKLHIDLSAKKAELAALNSQTLDAMIDAQYGNTAPLMKVISDADIYPDRKSVDLNAKVELKAAMIKSPVSYLSENFEPTYDKLLDTTSIAKEALDRGELLEYQYAQVQGAAFSVSADGKLTERQIKNGRTYVSPELIATPRFSMNYSSFASDLGGAVIEIRNQLKTAIDITLENRFQYALSANVPDASATQDDNLSAGAAHATHKLTTADWAGGKLTPAMLIDLSKLLSHMGSSNPSATSILMPTHKSPIGAFIVPLTALIDLYKAGTTWWTEETAEMLVKNAIVGNFKAPFAPIYMNPITDNKLVYAVTTKNNLGVFVNISINGKNAQVVSDGWGGGVEPWSKAEIYSWMYYAMYLIPYGIAQGTISGE